jgi:hypothetical protein
VFGLAFPRLAKSASGANATSDDSDDDSGDGDAVSDEASSSAARIELPRATPTTTHKQPSSGQQ